MLIFSKKVVKFPHTESFYSRPGWTVFLLRYLMHKTKKKSKEIIGIKCSTMVTWRKKSAGWGAWEERHRVHRTLFTFSRVTTITRVALSHLIHSLNCSSLNWFEDFSIYVWYFSFWKKVMKSRQKSEAKSN